ncbi:MAG: nitrous oxide reductase family maturation protein NosD [Vicinamibacterales bacterium]
MFTAALMLLAISIADGQGGEGHAVAPGAVEGRPAGPEASPLQAAIDSAPAGATIEIGPGTYRGDLIIERPLRLIGIGRPRLVGSGTGSVVRVRADDVTIEGFDIDGLEGGDLGRDSSGVHVSGRRATIRDCRIVRCLFGVYLREADGARVERCTITGIRGKDPGEKGSGIHAWSTDGFRFLNNEVTGVRDGFYIQSSNGGFIASNRAVDLRYGLHYMFSDDNVFEDNLFARGAAGTAIMYSRRVVFRRNRLLWNRGFASVGLLFKTCEDVLAEDNLVGDNARGIFLEDALRSVFRRNVIAQSDTAIVLYDSARQVLFEGNSFVGNMSPLWLIGKRTDTRFESNYWSDNDEPDLDGDGRSDRPFPLTSVFDHLRGNLTAADLVSHGFAAVALGVAERTFPVLQTVSVEDPLPLARPPALPLVPYRDREDSGPDAAGLIVSASALAAGALVLLRGTARRAAGKRPFRLSES